MEQQRKIRVAITHGDTNGVGYEQIFKIFDNPAMMELCIPIVYGSPKVATYHRKALGMDTQFTVIASPEEARDNCLNLITVFDEEIKVEIGQPSEESAEAARKALKQAIVDVQKGKADALVMAPDNLPDFLSREPEVLKVRMADDMRVALVTNQLALKDVPEAITRQRIVEKTRILHQCLRRDLSISSPRIAVLALNPVADDNTDWGEEEREMIIPAIAELEDEGIQTFGPYAAESFFGRGDYLRFDAVLAMYYDQGLTPLKSIAQGDVYTLVTGMPFVCVHPEQGVGYDIAGKGCADESALRNSIYMAIDVCRRRQNYDAPMKNPLPKLYKEKRDDSEKVRFAVPKSKEQPKKE